MLVIDNWKDTSSTSLGYHLLLIKINSFGKSSAKNLPIIDNSDPSKKITQLKTV